MTLIWHVTINRRQTRAKAGTNGYKVENFYDETN